MEYYKLPKKYNYYFKHLDNNQGLEFLRVQLEKLKSFNLDVLKRYKNYFDSSSDNMESTIISSDIKKFIIEFNKAENDILKQYKIYSKGSFGEDKVRDIIYTYDDEWKILNNARLVIEGNSIENDFIVIDESGITTIEVKNIGSYSEKLIIDSLGRVTRLNKSNKEIETYDMISQSNRHTAYLNKFINDKFDYKVPINSLVVITSNIKVVNKSNFKVIGPNQIYSLIKSQSNSINNNQSMSVYNELLNSLVEGNKYKYIDYISVLEENYKLILLSIKEYNLNN